MAKGHSFRRGATVVAIAALILALVATLPSTVAPGVAAAQSTWCMQHAGRCDATGAAGVWCNGFFEAGATACSAMARSDGMWCNGTFEPGASFCTDVAAAGGVWCDGIFESGASFCPNVTAASGVWCDGIFEPGAAVCPGVATSATAGVTCNGEFFSGQSFCPSAFTSVAPSINTAVTSAGEPVTFDAGWDIVAGPTGTVITGNVGPLYGFGPGSTTYTVVPPGTPLQAGMGYWAYFEAPTTEFLAPEIAGSLSTSLPAGHFVEIGNPGDTVATVSGADIVLTWNGGQYTQVTQLNPGQGAWAFSWGGAQAAIVNAPI